MNRMLKNILSGIGSVLVIYPASGYSNYRTTEHDFRRTDTEALSADVRAIGGDFYKAMEQGEARVTKEKERI